MPVVLRKNSRRTALFVHKNFPAQFGFVARLLQRHGVRCVSLSSDEGRKLPGVDAVTWSAARGTTPDILPHAMKAEADFIRGRAAVSAALALRNTGFEPEVIIGHPGWGETIFLTEVFPRAKLVIYGEYYYHCRNSDVDFDPEFPSKGFDHQLQVTAKNATLGLAYAEADRIVSPTIFQASLLPPCFRARATVIHEGIDTMQVAKRPDAEIRIRGEQVLSSSVPVITFINRCFEPLRGYHVFIRALPKFLKDCPTAHVLLIGHSGKRGYGAEAPEGTTWKAHFLKEVEGRLDESRVHFVGQLPHDQLISALSISWAHVYYTYPFVLSWSVLEAMAAECLVTGSDTAPVREVIEDGVNGFLCNFFDHELLADTLTKVSRSPNVYSGLRSAARQTILERFDRTQRSEPAWLELIGELTGWKIPN